MNSGVKKYLLNCFLLMFPVMAWNVLLTNRLPAAFQPEIFWKDIPAFLAIGENSTRIALFVLTLLMPLQITGIQKKGLLLYATGMIMYFVSWLLLICLPESSWSRSVFGWMAPAFTPLLWLTGISFTGNAYYFRVPYRPWHFMLVSGLFLVFHNYHAFTIYQRTH